MTTSTRIAPGGVDGAAGRSTSPLPGLARPVAVDLEVPIKTVSRPARIPRFGYLAKSGVFVREGERRLFFGGYCLGSDAPTAELVSRIEVIERLLATAGIVHKKTNGRYPDFAAVTWPDIAECAPVPSRRVLLAGLDPDASSLDATGLACRRDFLDSAEHAVFETVERHLLCQAWFRGGLLTELDSEQIETVGEACLRWQFFTSCRPDLIPFVIAICHDEQRGFLVCGSAAGSNFLEARSRAEREAAMLLDGILSDDRGPANSDKSRLLSLRVRETSSARLAHFHGKLANRRSWESLRGIHTTSSQAAARLFSAPVNIVPVAQYGDMHVVRALCDGAYTLPVERRRDANRSVPDPFC